LTENETKNRLLWFVQGPVSQNWRTMVQMEKVIRQASENVETRLDAFFDDPDDVETMHKFRVSIRTLRSLLAFLKPWQDRAQNQAMQADLKEVVAATSRLRELDVLSEQAAESEGASPGFVEFCESEAAAERERVSEFLAGKGVSKRLSRVRDQAKSIRWRSRPRKCGLPASEVRARFDAMAGELGADLECLDLAKVEETHDVRKSAKRVRYAAENFKELIGDDAVGIAKGMTAHQDNLGAVCDARVNIEIIDGFLERPDLPEPVAWDLALMKAENETFLYSTLRSQGATTES
jgi:CHAD domain-containing protein